MDDYVRRALEPLSEPQLALMRVAIDACREDGTWPFFSWVQAVMDQDGIEALNVLSSFPALEVYPYRRYAAAAADYMGRPPSGNSEVFVTALGIWHLTKEQPELGEEILAPFFKVLDAVATIRAEFVPPRREETLPDVTWAQIRSMFAPSDQPNIPVERMLVAILTGDQPPGLLMSGTDFSVETWRARLDRQLRLFRGVNEIADYLARRLIGRPSTPVTPPPALSSPLALASSLDYFNVVWRLAFDETTGPFRFASAERAARFAEDVATGEEFFAAMSALGDVISNIAVTGEPGSHPCDRLESRLRRRISEEALPRTLQGVDVLRAVARVRHTGQHSTVGQDVLRAWSDLGVSYPPSDWNSAWNAIRSRLVEALDAMRDELQQATDRSDLDVDPAGP